MEDTIRRLWGGCGLLSGRYEWTGQRKPRIINTYWALTNIYKSQKETVELISETFRTFQAVCKMSPSVPPTPHPLKLQSYVIRVTPNRLWQKKPSCLSFRLSHPPLSCWGRFSSGCWDCVHCVSEAEQEANRGRERRVGEAVCSSARLPRQDRGSQGYPPDRERAPQGGSTPFLTFCDSNYTM